MEKRLKFEDGKSECIYESEKVRLPARLNSWDYKHVKNEGVVEIKFSDDFKYIKRWTQKDINNLLMQHKLDRSPDIVIEDFLIKESSDLALEQHYKLFGITPPNKEDYDDKEDDYD